jgi:hypothetical protein
MKEQLQELLERDPFIPFKVIMTSGHEYEVANPHLVALAESQIILCVPRSDRYHVLRMNQIASFDVAQAA